MYKKLLFLLSFCRFILQINGNILFFDFIESEHVGIIIYNNKGSRLLSVFVYRKGENDRIIIKRYTV